MKGKRGKEDRRRRSENRNRKGEGVKKKYFFILHLLSFILFVLLCSVSAPTSGLAQKLEVYNLVLDNTNATLKVRFDLKIDGFNAIKEALDNGEDLGLVCRATIDMQRKFFWDRSLVCRNFLSTMRKDMLKGEYVIDLPGQTVRFTEFSAQRINKLFQNIEISLLPWSTIKKGQNYSLKVEVALKTLEIPEWIKKTLFFWSWDLIEPEYFEMEFRY